MKKLKSIDFKALFINHGEKFGLAVIVLVVILALAGTSWSRIKESPRDLETKITEAKNRINSPSNLWPAAKSEQFAVVDFNDQANRVFTGLPTAKYEFTTPMYWPLYRKKEKARDPEYLAPLYLIADPGLACLSMKSQSALMAETAEAANAQSTSPLDTPSDSLVRPPPGGQPAGATGFGPGGVAAPPNSGHGAGSQLGIAPARPPGGRPPASGPSAGHSAGPGPGSMPMVPGMDMYAAGGLGGGTTARGKRYVAVRAIVPLKEQVERAMKALNMNYADASAAIEYIDFTLQRQTAGAGDNPWPTEWETVDLNIAKEVLSEVADFDQDPVPSDLQDPVFTMQLPMRLLRYWGDEATHPNIKNFRLSEADWQFEMKLQAKMLEEAQKLEATAPPKVQKGGLADTTNDFRGLARQMSGNTEMMTGMMRYMNEGANGSRMTQTDLKNRMSASGRVYLFRYFDFDVQPGMAYRYRVKLKLRNPNFERPYEEVEDQEITKQPTRETAWSNICTPVVVPDTVNYFLKDIERDPARDKPSKKPVASIAMFEWDANLGTMLSDSLKILNIGQFISEKKKTWVLDPGTPKLEEIEKPFVTDDVLVDVSGDLELSPDLHPDLQLKGDRSKKEIKVGMLPEALVVTGLGELKELDTTSRAVEEKALSRKVDDERKSYEYLKNAPQQTNSALDSPSGNSMMDMMMQGTRGPANPRRRQGGSAGAGGSPDGAHGGAGPGESGPGGARSSPPGGPRRTR